jgi:small-conductance mechanosensitive channel
MNALTRPFGRDSPRTKERLFVDYGEDTERALMELRAVASDQEAALDEPAPTARVDDLGENSSTVRAAFWVEGPQRGSVAAVRSDFHRRIKRKFDEERITVAPPSGQEPSGEVAVERVADGR